MGAPYAAKQHGTWVIFWHIFYICCSIFW